jgi:hypothetical protein
MFFGAPPLVNGPNGPVRGLIAWFSLLADYAHRATNLSRSHLFERVSHCGYQQLSSSAGPGVARCAWPTSVSRVPSAIALRRPGNARVHDAAVFYVAAELSRRDLRIEELWHESGADLAVRRGRSDRTLVRVKGKTSTEWQARIDLARLEGTPRRLVVFVDMDPRTASVPSYWIAEETWVINDIKRHHQAYLDKHGGIRPRSPKAKHHSISVVRLVKWRDRWDLFAK